VKLIADESVDYAIIQALRIKGFEIYSITEQSSGINDKKDYPDYLVLKE